MNSPLTPVAGLRAHRRAIVAHFVVRRKISHRAIWDFFNSIRQKQSFELWLSSIIRSGLRQLASEIAMKQRRQQLAPREIAGRAEPCKNERSHRDHSAGHAGAFLDSIPELPLSRTGAARPASTSATVGRLAPLRETVTAAAAMA